MTRFEEQDYRELDDQRDAAEEKAANDGRFAGGAYYPDLPFWLWEMTPEQQEEFYRREAERKAKKAAAVAKRKAEYEAWCREDERRERQWTPREHWNTATNRYLDESKRRNP